MAVYGIRIFRHVNTMHRLLGGMHVLTTIPLATVLINLCQSAAIFNTVQRF